MKSDLQTVQSIPIGVREFSLTPFRKDYVVKNPALNTYAFLDEEGRVLLESLKTPKPISDLVRIYHDRFGAYSYKKVFDFVVRLLQASLLTPESEAALRTHPLFQSVFAAPPARPILPVSGGGILRAIGPLVRWMDTPAAIVLLILTAVGSAYGLAANFPSFELFTAGNRYLYGLAAWLVSITAVISLRNGFKYVLLLGKGLDAPRAGIHLRWIIPYFDVDDSDILTQGWADTLRYHLAILFFPAALAALGLGAHAAVAAPQAGIWILACALVTFLDLSPFVRGELLKALDRLSGTFYLLETLKNFVHRKFAARIVSFGSTFEFESALIGHGIYSIVWIFAAYRLASAALDRHVGRLTDTVILADSIPDRLAALAFVVAIVFPFFTIVGGILRLIAVNLHSFFEKPLNQILRSIRGKGRRADQEFPNDAADFLRGIPLLATLPEGVRTKLAGHLRVERFGKGRPVVWQGDVGESFYIIYDGTAEVVHEEPSGARKILADLSARDSFGEIALIEDSPRTATVRARTPLVCLVIHKKDFKQFIEAELPDRDQITKIIQLTAFLKDVPIFSDVPPDMFTRVILEMKERDARPGEIILRQGDTAEEFFIIRSGSVAVWKNHDSQDAAQVATLSSGDVFGEIALFEDTYRTATVVAGDNCRYLAMPKQTFFHILRANIVSGLWIESTVRARRKSLSRVS